jgi:hypothetical protein
MFFLKNAGGREMLFAKPNYLIIGVFIILLISCWELYYKFHFPVVSNTNENVHQTKFKDQELVRLFDQNLRYRFNHKIVENTAFLKNNDIRHYSMYVLPEFQLVPGNDGSDHLYYKVDKDIHMKIEVIPMHVHLALIKNYTKKELSNLTDETIFESSLEGQYLDESVRLEVINNQQVISTYLLHFPEMKLKLTMVTPKDVDIRDAFLQMANTIVMDKTDK